MKLSDRDSENLQRIADALDPAGVGEPSGSPWYANFGLWLLIILIVGVLPMPGGPLWPIELVARLGSPEGGSLLDWGVVFGLGLMTAFYVYFFLLGGGRHHRSS